MKYDVAPPHVQAFARQVKDEYEQARRVREDADARYKALRQSIQRLRGMGMGAPAIAETVGLSERLIRTWTNN